MTNPVVQSSLMTVKQRIAVANDVINDWSTSNTYISIGHEAVWKVQDALIDVPNQSTDYLNSVYRNSVGIKKITAADMAFVIPRIDWQSGEVYSQYDSSTDMFSTINYTLLAGTINVADSRTITNAANTLFVSQLTSGDLIFLPGDGEAVAPQTRQVIDIFSNTSMNVNTAFTGTFTSNNVFLVQNTAPDFAENFYVRNIFDQVFKCLYNNNNAVSTQMPQISIGGQLPENAYILTSDGYKWKYMYTIPSFQKQKFFSTDWMPVYSDPVVVESAVPGRIDIVEILNSGSGYNQNVASNVASILTVVGDGTGANVTAKVDSNGAIFDTNILNAGLGYTYANLVITSGTTGVNANIKIVIGPEGGHGFNPAEELGATSMMLSVEVSGDENGTIPTIASIGTDVFTYRQVAIIKAPLLAASSTEASNANYSTVYQINTQSLPAGQFFHMDETIFQGTTLATATFQATVVFWDDVNDIIHLNNPIGSFAAVTPIRGTDQTTPVTAFSITKPIILPFTGKVLYVNNILPVSRTTDQTEQVRLIISF